MSDDQIRRFQREAVVDPSRWPAWLRARVQAGEVSRERVGLAAYCGDPGAQVVVGGYAEVRPPHAPLQAWLAGLSCWGPSVLARAAVVAGEVALEVWWGENAWRDCDHKVRGLPADELCQECFGAPGLALTAARAWCDDPTEERREAWQEAQGNDMPTGLPEFVPRVHDVEVARDRAPKENWTQRIQAAARLTSEAEVRAAICEALIGWSLGPPPW